LTCTALPRRDTFLHGASVDKNLAGADETASLVKQSRGKAEPLQVDVGDEASVDDMGQKIAADYRRIDIVVNNAGIATNTPRTHEFSPPAMRSR
jgi:NAD(P)-dependent dehydrogenase (short-subunit alcohol dehydrogenase family)